MTDALEQFFGCDCGCLNHISRMGYFPPEKDEKIDEEDNVIYFSVKTEYLYKRILPPFSFDPRNWLFDFEYYFRFHILRRIPIAARYLFNPLYTREHGILDCFDFQNKDLSLMRKFLSHLTDEESETIKKNEIIDDLDSYSKKIIDKYLFCLSNDRWRLKFTIWRIDENFPYWLGWEPQFIPRKIFGRIRYALKYIFGRVDDEQYFEIDKETAKKIKGLITVVEKLNERN